MQATLKTTDVILYIDLFSVTVGSWFVFLLEWCLFSDQRLCFCSKYEISVFRQSVKCRIYFKRKEEETSFYDLIMVKHETEPDIGRPRFVSVLVTGLVTPAVCDVSVLIGDWGVWVSSLIQLLPHYLLSNHLNKTTEFKSAMSQKSLVNLDVLDGLRIELPKEIHLASL